MKYLLKLFLVVLTATISLAAYAADKDEITLTVTSDGATKDEAIKNALCTAVEQTYGVFISANTDILNDEIIKDEIATVSSGNIKKFTEVAYTKNDNSHTVTLDVIVSKGKLLSYAKSNGAECELDGEAMFADIQLQELYKHNEEKLFENLCKEFENLIKDGYDYKLDVKRADNLYNTNPENNVCFECRIYVKLNEQGELAWKKLMTALKEVGQSYKFLPPNDESQEFSATVKIPNPGSMWGDQKFRVRSYRTAQLVHNLMREISYYVKNISLEYAGKRQDVSSKLHDSSFYKDSYLKMYSRKKGSNCGKYQCILEIPKEELKNLKGVTVKPNGSLYL